MNPEHLFDQVFEPATDITSMSKAAHKVNRAMAVIKKKLCPALTTRRIAQIVEYSLIESGVDPDFKIFVSPEEVVWHGIPDNRILREGQIVTVDIACSVHGWWTDTAATFPVGNIDTKRTKLLKAAKEGTVLAAQWIKDGSNGKKCTSDLQQLCIQRCITLIVEANGHGLGRQLHKAPYLTYTENGHEILQSGRVYTAEPVFTSGHGSINMANNGAAYTVDGLPSAHFELSVLAGDGHSCILGEPDWLFGD